MNYKLQKGYGEDGIILIDETELVPAIKARVTGKTALLKNGVISGSHIISILPDWDSAPKVYNPSGDDFLPAGVRQEYLLALENAEEIVRAGIENRPPQLKEPEAKRIGNQTYTQGLTSMKDLLKGKDGKSLNQ